MALDTRTANWLRDVVDSEDGDREAAARWLSRNMFSGIRHWRQAISEAMEGGE